MEPVRYTIRLTASSNISYDRKLTGDLDREEWEEMSREDQRELIKEMIEDAVWSDISGHVEFDDMNDDPDVAEDDQ